MGMEPPSGRKLELNNWSFPNNLCASIPFHFISLILILRALIEVVNYASGSASYM